MARVLLAWELGDGLGHIHCLLPIALRMRALGHQCLFAVRNIHNSYDVLARHGFPILQAPLVRVRTGEARSFTIADILANADFGRADRLAPLLAAWDAAVDLARPDIVVGDYTPGLCLALRGSDLPVAIVGGGMMLPPDTDAFPVLVDDQARPPDPPSDTLLSTINDVLLHRRRPPLAHLPEIFTAAARFVTTLPELDCHDALRDEASRAGPTRRLPPPSDVPPVADYFAYLALDWPHTATVLEAMATSGMTGGVYLREASPEQIAAWRERGLVVHAAPRDLEAEVAAAAVLIHHGGLGTMEIGLARGRPQLLLPRYLEQHLNASAAGRLGVSLRTPLRGAVIADQVGAALQRLRRDDSFARRARIQAERIASSRRPPGVDRIVPVLERLLASSPEAATRFVPVPRPVAGMALPA